jgi:hypothetical protein
VRAPHFFPGPNSCANLPQERIRGGGGGDKTTALEMPRKLESWVEISESVSRLCTFDAGNGAGGGISVILLLFLLSPLAFLRFYLGPSCSIFIPVKNITMPSTKLG